MSETAQAADVVVSEEARMFARERGLEEHLPAMVAEARQDFPGAAVSIVLEEDPAIRDMCFLVVTIRGVKGDAQQVQAASDKFAPVLFALVNAHSSCTFRVSRAEETEAESRERLSLKKPPTVPDDVWAFAIRHHVAKQLPAVLEMTRSLFPGREPTVELEADPELPESYFVVNVLALGVDVPRAVKARSAWGAGVATACPGPGGYLFRLRMETRG